MSATTGERDDTQPHRTKGPLVYRQSIWTRVTHWVWVICLFFLLFSGLQIFNAHPTLYIGQESGFEYDNSVLSMHAERRPEGGYAGYTTVLGNRIDTSGVFGYSGTEANPEFRGFPSWLTIPSYRDLATGRVVHFFFAWILVGVLFVWAVASFFNGHLRRDIVPKGADLKALPADAAEHARFRFRHHKGYNALQKLAYAFIFFIVFPAIILTGLSMSPGMNTAWPWLIEVFGGRQTARTIHFTAMLVLVLFFIVHIVMVVLAGPINELRSMITGWYRVDPGKEDRS
ncbi:cytochrome b/b6 domain-containing protein [Pelagibacterium xiamenense]|uniref:cytochrome b/b6 domain-containing protein n=1 Tax=Pelagibacterium xiamenense TaxID=2901140 RepID=UPI001E3B20B7|nr:cytochrome b/b6 domain-containing protein [Pelagibacterium xiamenense]MCD7060372.1 cytochrome b/b6 domain-containing protein [Pelagibacterium xiamenense]